MLAASSPYYNKIKKLFGRKDLKVSNNKGMALLEVMIAAGLLGVVSLGVMKVMKDMTKTSKTSQQSFEFSQAASAINSILKDGYSCKATLEGLNPSSAGTKVDEVIRKKANGSSLSVYKIGDVLGAVGSKVFIKNMEVKNFDSAKGLGDFVIVLNKGKKDYDSLNDKEKERIRKTSFGAAYVTKTIKLNMLLDSSGNIKDCVSDKDLYTTGACAILNGDFSDKVKCKSLNIEGVAALGSAPEKPAITATGNLLVSKNISLGTNPASPSQMIFNNKAKILATADADELQLLSHTTPQMGKLKLGNKDTITGKNGELTISSDLAVFEGDVQFVNQLRVGQNEESIFELKNAKLDISGAVVEMSSAAQNLYANPTSSEDKMVATRGWVKQLISKLLKGDVDTLGDIAKALVDYSNSQQLNLLKRNICESTEHYRWSGNKCVFSKSEDCGPNNALRGWSSGSPKCQPIVPVGQTCGDGRPSKGHSSNGVLQCDSSILIRLAQLESELADLKKAAATQAWIGKNCAGVVGNVCKVNGTSCPSGTSKMGSWSATSSVTCNGGSTTGCNNGPSCNTGGHGFGNTAPETCRAPRYAACGPATSGWGPTCTATITMVGCSIKK